MPSKPVDPDKVQEEKNIQVNQELTPEDRHYLRFVMKQSRCFEAVLAGGKPDLQGDWKETYQRLCVGADTHKLDQYLRRSTGTWSNSIRIRRTALLLSRKPIVTRIMAFIVCKIVVYRSASSIWMTKCALLKQSYKQKRIWAD